jgi:cell division protease FtsH
MEKKRSDDPSSQRRPGNSWLILLVLLLAFGLIFFNREEDRSKVSASFFNEQLDKNNVESVEISGLRVVGTFKTEVADPTRGVDAKPPAVNAKPPA